MKKKEKKTNAMRLMDMHHMTYETLSYAWEEGRHAGVHVAEMLQLNPSSVFKTLVGIGDKTGPVVFCIPVDKELDVKKGARESNNKSVTLLPLRDLLSVTGYVRGGCSPIGMKKSFPTYLDKTMEDFESIYISGGLRGLQMKVCPQDIRTLVKGVFVPLTHDE